MFQHFTTDFPFQRDFAVSYKRVSDLRSSSGHRQSLHKATWPTRESLQGQRRWYLALEPAQLNSSGSCCRPHSACSAEKAGRRWFTWDSTPSHWSSSLRTNTEQLELLEFIFSVFVYSTLSLQYYDNEMQLALTSTCNRSNTVQCYRDR